MLEHLYLFYALHYVLHAVDEVLDSGVFFDCPRCFLQCVYSTLKAEIYVLKLILDDHRICQITRQEF